MEYKFSNRVQSLKPSAIREIFKYAADPEVISLSAGNPSPEAFPTKAIEEITASILEKNPIAALQYSITEGYAPLRETLKDYMKKTHNVGREFDELVVTSGAQQVMDLTTKSLCNAGDVVICEAPSFIGSLNSFRSYGVRLRGVPMDDDGMNLEALETALREEPNAKFIYTIPNFQNPSGITMSLEKRKKVYELAKRYGVLILEDNPYGDLRIEGEDVHTNILAQMIANEFMTKYDYPAHIQFLRDLYRKKAKFAMDLMDQYLLPKITYKPIQGGLFIWCTLPEGVDMPDFCKQAVLRKVCVVPGNAFLTDESEPCQCFRTNFSTPTDQQLEKGIKILGQLVNELI